MALEDLEIGFDQVHLRSAMDVYYEQLLSLVPPHDGEKLCLGSSLVIVPFRREAAEYNNFLVRLLADRIIDQGSPKRLPDNLALGSLDSAEHFSARYRDFVQLVLDQQLAELPTDVLEKYNAQHARHDDEATAYRSKLDEISVAWRRERESSHPGKADADLERERAAFFNHRQADFEQLRMRLAALRRTRALMVRLLREAPPQARLAQSITSAFDDADQYLPNAADPSIRHQWDAVWLRNPLNTLGDPAYLEKRPAYVSTFDYDVLLTKGHRDIVISSAAESRNEHARAWAASAAARFGYFFKAKVQESETTRTTDAVRNLSRIEVKFQQLYEVLIGRGSWYDKDVFQKPCLANGDYQKRLAARVQYAVKSVILARGLTLLLRFDDEPYATYFRQFSASGKAGIGFLGGLLPLGGGSSCNSLSKSDDSSFDSRTVSFADEEDVVRMIGYRVEQVHDAVCPREAATLMANGRIPVDAIQELLRTQSRVKDFNFRHALL